MPHEVVFWMMQVAEHHQMTLEEVIEASFGLALKYGGEIFFIDILTFDAYITSYLTDKAKVNNERG